MMEEVGVVAPTPMSHPSRPHSPGVSALMVACQQGIESDVKAILNRKPQLIAQKDRSGKTALHYCAENAVTTCANLLLASDPSLLNTADDEGYTALHLAVISGNRRIAHWLLRKGADTNCIDIEGHSPIHWATVCGEVECLRLLLDCGANPSTPDIHGAYPIHYASQMCGPNSEMGNNVRVGLAVLRTLLDRGVDVNCEDQDGRQPLLWAASAGSGDAILALVNAGASVCAVDKDGLTALHCASSRGHVDCLDAMISLCGAEADFMDNNGCTSLFYAVTLGHADCTHLLLKYGAEPNRQDRKGRTAAHCGAAKGQLETLKILAHHGANLWIRNVRGDLPLHEAVQSGRRDLVRWLIDQLPAAVNAGNSNGRTSLHIASINNNIEMCKVLMDVGAYVNPLMRNSKGQLMTPLDAGLHRGNRGCAKYLQLHGALPANKLLERHEINRALLTQLENRTRSQQKALTSRQSKNDHRVETVEAVIHANSEKEIGLQGANHSALGNGTQEAVSWEPATHGSGQLDLTAIVNTHSEKITEKSSEETVRNADGVCMESRTETVREVSRQFVDEHGQMHTVDEHKTKLSVVKTNDPMPYVSSEGGLLMVSVGVTEGSRISITPGDKGLVTKATISKNGTTTVDSAISPRSSINSSETQKDSGFSEDNEGRGSMAADMSSDGSCYEDQQTFWSQNGGQVKKKRRVKRRNQPIDEESGPSNVQQQEVNEQVITRTSVAAMREANRILQRPTATINMSNVKAKVDTGMFSRYGDGVHNRTRFSKTVRTSEQTSKYAVSESIAQEIQQSLRKYHLERKLFQELQDLKHHQIRSGRANEAFMVKRLVDKFRREILTPGMKSFQGAFTYKNFERYLYDQLRLLSASNHGKVPKLKAAEESPLESTIVLETETCANPAQCVIRTYKCNHAAKAYGGTSNMHQKLPALRSNSSSKSESRANNQSGSTSLENTSSSIELGIANNLKNASRKPTPVPSSTPRKNSSNASITIRQLRQQNAKHKNEPSIEIYQKGGPLNNGSGRSSPGHPVKMNNVTKEAETPKLSPIAESFQETSMTTTVEDKPNSSLGKTDDQDLTKALSPLTISTGNDDDIESNDITPMSKIEKITAAPLRNDNYPPELLKLLASKITESTDPDAKENVFLEIRSGEDRVQTLTMKQLLNAASECRTPTGGEGQYRDLECTRVNDDQDEKVTEGPLVFEIKCGRDKNVFSLPEEAFKQNERWRVTFVIRKRDGQQPSEEGFG